MIPHAAEKIILESRRRRECITSRVIEEKLHLSCGIDCEFRRNSHLVQAASDASVACAAGDVCSREACRPVPPPLIPE